MDALKIEQAIIAGFDWGARTADIVAALWPERCKALVSVSGYLIGSQEAGKQPLPPKAELAWWYQFYFATERGRAGYDAIPARLRASSSGSSRRRSGTSTTPRSSARAASFDNPDHVGIVIHNYRWRLGLAEGEPQYDELEQRLAAGPGHHACPRSRSKATPTARRTRTRSAYAAKFTGTYAHRVITGGIGHNLPQEAPQAFAQAVDRRRRFWTGVASLSRPRD